MKTELIKISADDIDDGKIAAAAEMLDAGQLVAFPTETVYGIGCLAEAEAIGRLDEVKGRPADKRYTLHIGDREDVYRYVPSILPHERKLIANVWPGPVTIVFELSDEDLKKQKAVVGSEVFGVLYCGGTIGIRCVADEVASRILRSARGAIVAPSANLSGEKPSTNAQEVMSIFSGRIDGVVEVEGGGGGSDKSSTVAKLSRRGIEVLREGVVSEAEIAAMSQIKILFVCAGNTCRSPMAEGFCRKIISEKLNCSIDGIENIGYKIASAGVMAGMNMPPSPEAVDICGQSGVDISGHGSRRVDCDEAQASDFIFTMGRSHERAVGELCPNAAERCMLLDVGGDIADPIGGGLAVYSECAKQIEKALKKRISEIWHEDSGSK